MTNPTLPTNLLFSTTFPVRMFIDGNDNPWFCHKDVSDVLGYKNSRDALSKHCKAKGIMKRDTIVSYKKDTVAKRDTISEPSEFAQTKQLTYINEGNLYRLIVKSKKPQAEEFEEWVFEEVLPQIRKTGSYELCEEDINPITAQQLKNIRDAIANCTRYMKHNAASLAQTMYRNMKKEFGYDKIECMPEETYQSSIDWIRGHELVCHQYYMAVSRVEISFIRNMKKQDFEKAAEIGTDVLMQYGNQNLLEASAIH